MNTEAFDEALQEDEDAAMMHIQQEFDEDDEDEGEISDERGQQLGAPHTSTATENDYYAAKRQNDSFAQQNSSSLFKS